MVAILCTSVYGSACSTAGLVRQRNEDSFTLMRQAFPPGETKASLRWQGWLTWCAVMDGMGGERLGDAASRAAAEALARQGGRLRWGKPARAADALVRRMNDAVRRTLGGQRGGTTLALAFLRGGRLYTCHAGDSRIYLLRDGALTRLTRDHVPGGAVRNPKDAPRAHALLRYLGAEEDGAGLCQTGGPLRVRRGDRLLLCSDGITDMLADGDILRIMKAADTPEQASQALLDAAMAAGGRDNATAVVLFIGKNLRRG